LRDTFAPRMSWWDPVYPFEQLEEKWNSSLDVWINFLKSKTEEEIFEEGRRNL
jgi:hypothetical protein